LLNNSINNASLDPTCDYILRDQQEQLDYSYACGCLITMIITLGIVDMHVENMIVSNKLPVLIDLENCFYIDSHPAINKTLVFQHQRGSFSHKSTSPKQYSEIFDITGLQTPAIEIVEKNRSYTVYRIVDNKPIPYIIDATEAGRGIDSTLDILHNQSVEFDIWFKEIKERNLCVRYTPARTSEFKNQIDVFFDRYLIGGSNNVPNEIEEFKKIILEEGEQEIGQAVLQNPLFINNNAIYNTNSIDRYMDEILGGNVPIYFTLINSKLLFDFSSRSINDPFPEHIISQASVQNSALQPMAHIDFFPVKPLDHIYNRFQGMVANRDNEKIKLKEELVISLQQERPQPVESKEETTCCSPQCRIM
jgi:hypothetical protein